ncbi:MAG: glycoside hydrolase family 88 protein [Candidatus Omnitrophica bacterium]|nr:glycoside hydrolase family 88 protein [Candidatus Omnitrophota bacterium]
MNKSPNSLLEIRDSLLLAMDHAEKQVSEMTPKWPAGSPAPIYTVDGKWFRQKNIWTDWTPGFYAGMMWMLFESTGKQGWRDRAIEFSLPLEERKFDRDVHDLGFIFMSTYKRWHDLLEPGPERDKVASVLVTAGNTQSLRWKETGEDHYIFSFNGPQSLFIDIMMNIRVLFWAYRHSGNENLYNRAITHARTTRKYIVRDDGAAIHEGIFNPIRGEFRNLSTQQGYSPWTCWSRGLAWAIYGFHDTFLYTGEKEFLETAELCSQYYFDHPTEDGVPYWDYGAPNIPEEEKDSSAAAVIASAFLSMAETVPEKSDLYLDAAAKILNSLTTPGYLTVDMEGHEGILTQGVYHKPMGWGVNESVMWGEYFFLEAVHKALGLLRSAP